MSIYHGQRLSYFSYVLQLRGTASPYLAVPKTYVNGPLYKVEAPQELLLLNSIRPLIPGLPLRVIVLSLS